MSKEDRHRIYSDFYICKLIRENSENVFDKIRGRLSSLFEESSNPKERSEYESLMDYFALQIMEENEI